MQAKETTLVPLLEGEKQYFVPLYQRTPGGAESSSGDDGHGASTTSICSTHHNSSPSNGRVESRSALPPASRAPSGRQPRSTHPPPTRG